MLEGKVTQKLLKELRNKIPSAWICKHSNSYVGGIPDFSITYRDSTSWWEIKTDSKVSLLQAETLKRIGSTAHVIIWKPNRWEIQNYLQQFQCFGVGFNILVETIIFRCEALGK